MREQQRKSCRPKKDGKQVARTTSPNDDVLLQKNARVVKEDMARNAMTFDAISETARPKLNSMVQTVIDGSRSFRSGQFSISGKVRADYR